MPPSGSTSAVATPVMPPPSEGQGFSAPWPLPSIPWKTLRRARLPWRPGLKDDPTDATIPTDSDYDGAAEELKTELLRLTFQFWEILLDADLMSPTSKRTSADGARALLKAARNSLTDVKVADLEVAKAQVSFYEKSFELSALQEKAADQSKMQLEKEVILLDQAPPSLESQLRGDVAKRLKLLEAAEGRLKVAFKELRNSVSDLSSLFSVPASVLMQPSIRSSRRLGPKEQVFAAQSAVEKVPGIQGELTEAKAELDAVKAKLAYFKSAERKLQVEFNPGFDGASTQAQLEVVQKRVLDLEQDVQMVSDAVAFVMSRLQTSAATAQRELVRANVLVYGSSKVQVVSPFQAANK